MTARWRLQVIAETGYGLNVGAVRADEDARVSRLRQATRGR